MGICSSKCECGVVTEGFYHCHCEKCHNSYDSYYYNHCNECCLTIHKNHSGYHCCRCKETWTYQHNCPNKSQKKI